VFCVIVPVLPLSDSVNVTIFLPLSAANVVLVSAGAGLTIAA
jgi:hypothetical protein